MSKKVFSILSVLLVFLFLFSAQVPAAIAQEGGGGEIIDRVLERGKVVCGGRTDLAGFGMLDEEEAAKCGDACSPNPS